jgi:hypothetical protein
MSTFNWSDLQQAADDAGFTVLSPRKGADAEVVDATFKKTANGKDQYAVRFKLLGGPDDGKSVFNNFVISPDNANALGFFFRHMAALGLTREYFASNPPKEAVAKALVGRRCRLDISIRTWNDQDRNQVDNVLPPIGGATTVSPAVGGPYPSVPDATPPIPTPQAFPIPTPQPYPTPTHAAVPVTPVTPLAEAPTPTAEPATPSSQAYDDAMTPPDLPF